MRLFLASVAARTVHLMPSLFSIDPKTTTVCFVPTAADSYPDPSFVEEDKNALRKLGFKIRVVDLKGKKEKQLAAEMQGCNVIFVAGGNTFFLLQEARKSGFDRLVKARVKKEVVFVGSSAGSVLVGPTIEPVKTLDNPAEASELSSFEGLHLIDQVILPHAGDPESRDQYQKIVEQYSATYRCILLTDDEALVIDGNHTTVIRTPDGTRRKKEY